MASFLALGGVDAMPSRETRTEARMEIILGDKRKYGSVFFLAKTMGNLKSAVRTVTVSPVNGI